MQKYVTVYRNVAPKRAALQAATDSLEIKRTQMLVVYLKRVMWYFEEGGVVL